MSDTSQELREQLLDTLKDHALKLVANAHSEMSEEQFDKWVNEHTDSYADALTSLSESNATKRVIEELKHVQSMQEEHQAADDSDYYFDYVDIEKIEDRIKSLEASLIDGEKQ